MITNLLRRRTGPAPAASPSFGGLWTLRPEDTSGRRVEIRADCITVTGYPADQIGKVVSGLDDLRLVCMATVIPHGHVLAPDEQAG